MGCRAVSRVAVTSASRCRCRSVIGYSATGSEKSATRSAVCFQLPVSLKTRTFAAERHSFIPSVTDIGGTNWYAAPNVRWARARIVSRLFSWTRIVDAASSSSPTRRKGCRRAWL